MFHVEHFQSAPRRTTAWMRVVGALFLIGLVPCPLLAQSSGAPTPENSPSQSQASPAQKPNRPPTSNSSAPDAHSSGSAQTRITPEQAQQLFSSVDSILKFDSNVTGLPILHPVKRRLVTRDEVVQYLTQQLHKGRDMQRLERSELVMKKFGLLDPDFDLQPFLVRLLREQIAGYYDAKTKTVNLLDWIAPAEQKPVLAHELTHALQDQHIHLENWDRVSDLSISKNVKQDNEHIATDEDDTARDAVVEGQAMAAFVDYALAPTGKNLLSAPDLADRMNQALSDSSDSPTLASAPLVLQQSLLFPYADGLSFVRAVLTAKGKQAAFAGLLDRPPTSTYEIMTPSVYLNREPVPLLRMPDIHPFIDAQYRPYDVGVIGEFDVKTMAELFGGAAISAALTPAWRGGIYYIAQSKAAKTSGERASLKSLSLLYLSHWETPMAAQAFAGIYAREIPRKYSHAVEQAPSDNPLDNALANRIWTTPAGPVVISVSKRTVFVSEGFPLDLARKLEAIMIGSVADAADSVTVRLHVPASPDGNWTIPQHDLTGALRTAMLKAGIPRAVFAVAKLSH